MAKLNKQAKSLIIAGGVILLLLVVLFILAAFTALLPRGGERQFFQFHLFGN